MKRAWFEVHKRSSLVCMGFLLVLCVTGLPLMFANEIDRWADGPVYADLPDGKPRVSLEDIQRQG